MKCTKKKTALLSCQVTHIEKPFLHCLKSYPTNKMIAWTFRECQESLALSSIIKAVNCFSKRNVIFKREIRSNKSNTKNFASVLKDKSLQVKYIVRVAMKNNYLWRLRERVHINQESRKARARLNTPESLKTGNAINKLCRHCVKAGITLTMITATKIWV